jgi:predicted nucleotidyltransferase
MDSILGVKIYLFGSILQNINANDVDVLFVYDDKLITAKDVYKVIEQARKDISKYFNKYVHLMILSETEINKTDIILRFGCVELSQIGREHHLKLLNEKV